MTILREGLRDKEEGCANSQSQPSLDVDHHKDSELPQGSVLSLCRPSHAAICCPEERYSIG